MEINSMGWKLNSPLISFRHGRVGKSKHIKTNPDIVPYSHDPPGHTCGLPCCSEDLQIQLRVQKPTRSCIGFQDYDIIQQNFTFRGRLKPQAVPVLESGFFSVQAPKEPKRGTIPKFGSVSVGGLKRIAEDQKQLNFLKGREITLPESKDPNMVEKLYLEDFNVGESEDMFVLPDDEIEYYLSVRKPNDNEKGVPYNPCDLDMPSIYPWDMLKDIKQGNESTHEDKADDSSSSNYYEVLQYPDEGSKPSLGSKPFQIPVPLPPKLPAQTIFNHPPLSKISSPALCENYLNQVTKGNNQPQKFNTYSSVYSYYAPTYQIKDSYENHHSFDQAITGLRSFRPDVREINFTNGKRQIFDLHHSNSNSLFKDGKIEEEMKQYQKNSANSDRKNVMNFTEELHLKLKLKENSNEKTVDDKISLVSKTNDDDDDDNDDIEIGISNPAFKHVNIDGKVNSTKTLNIGGKLLGTRSLDYRQKIQGISDLDWKMTAEKSKSLDFRKRSANFRIMDIEGNAFETKSLELLDKVGKDKLISLMEDDAKAGNAEEDDNPITLIL